MKQLIELLDGLLRMLCIMGKKECFELVTVSDRKIIATGDHKFYVGDNRYKELRELKVNDTIYIHNNTTVKKES